MQPTTGPSRVPGALCLVGGLVVIGSGFLDWFGLATASQQDTLKGLEFSIGQGIVVVGVVLAVAGLLLLARPRKGWAITAVVLASVVGLMGGWAALAPEESLASFAAKDVGDATGISEAGAEAAVAEAIRLGALEVSAGAGGMASLGGGVVGLLGGILGIRASRQRI